MTVLKDDVPQAHGGSRLGPLDSIVSNDTTLLTQNSKGLSNEKAKKREKKRNLAFYASVVTTK